MHNEKEVLHDLLERSLLEIRQFVNEKHQDMPDDQLYRILKLIRDIEGSI